MFLYQYFKTKIDSKSVIDININLAQKLTEYNLPENTQGFAIAVAKDEYDYKIAPRMLQRYFYKSCGAYTKESYFSSFNSILAEKIIMNSLTTKNEIIDDFEFDIEIASFLFSSFIVSDSYLVFAFFSLNEAGDNKMKYYNRCDSLSFVEITKENEIRYFIENERPEKLKKLFELSRDIDVWHMIQDFKNNNHKKIDIIDYSDVRMESDSINAIVKIAEYLGHGTYMGTMKEEVKNDIKKCIFGNDISSDFSISHGIKLANSTIYYTGKGPDKEKLIVLS